MVESLEDYDKLRKDFSDSINLHNAGIRDEDIPIVRFIIDGGFRNFLHEDIIGVEYSGGKNDLIKNDLIIFLKDNQKKFIAREVIEKIRNSSTFRGENAMIRKPEDLNTDNLKIIRDEEKNL